MNRSYGIFAERARKKGIDIFVANYSEYKDGIMSRAWAYGNNKWVKAKDVMPVMIYSRFNKAIYKDNSKHKKVENMKYKMHEQIGLFNDPHLEEFCWDKCICAELFPAHSPKTFLINTKKGLKVILPEMKTDKIVLKPRYGTLGEDVIITEKDKLPDKISRNTIVQEFVDGSHGIKGLVKGYHDMRVIVINGEIDHCHIRIPKKGVLTANMSLGGDKLFIPKSRIPQKVEHIVKRIDKMLDGFYPRLFSVDFVFDEKQRPYIVECNASPCMHRYAFGKYKKISYYDHFLDAMRSGIKLKIVETVE
jgi:glutathione synthase/RimK-type ligase-like ATP-grasp enzyme